MIAFATIVQWIAGTVLILSSLGVIVARKPVHASLSFLLTLFMLAILYLELSAQFIAAMQVLVYAGAILVIFMFVMVLFQDAHEQIDRYESRSSTPFLWLSGSALLLAFLFLGRQLFGPMPVREKLPEEFGSAQALGHSLYLDFFFPFEAVTLLFLIAAIGAVYIGRKER